MAEATKVTSDFQGRYMRVEYDLAVIAATLAARWQEYDDDDILVFRTANDARVRDSHKALHGIAKPKNDPFWKVHYPPLSWNCRCTVVVSSQAKITPDDQLPPMDDKAIPPMFRSNFAEEGFIFGKGHTYWNCNITNLKSLSYREIPHKNGKIIESHIVNRKAADYKEIYKCAELFCETTNGIVEILPKIHIKSILYDHFFGTLKDSIYYGKCPDLKVNDKYYELEGYSEEGNPKNRLGNMIGRAVKQSPYIIITDEGSSDNHIKKVVNFRIGKGQIIKEVWVKNGKNLRRIF